MDRKRLFLGVLGFLGCESALQATAIPAFQAVLE